MAKKITFAIRSVPPVDKIFFVQNLALMVKTGFSISDALQALIKQTKNNLFKRTIAQLHHDVLAGVNFASALSKHPAVFNELFVNLVATGEISGNLENTLQEIAVQLKKSYALKRKIRNAMIYPALIVTVMIIVGVGVFVFVVPKILDLYTQNNYVLPLPTRIILWLSTFLQHNALVISVSVIAIVLGMIGLWRTTGGRQVFDKLLLRLPIVGEIIKKVTIAKMMRILNSLIVTDIPIVKSYQLIAHALGNTSYRNHLLQSSELLTKGGSLYSTISSRADLFNPVIAQMVNVGEQTGALDKITAEIATFYEDEVEAVMSNLTVIIEPVLMVAIGAGVGFLAVAIVMPIYALVEQI
ncbi:MAG: type II secretion system F family protein [Candidatus Kerfeldbacteria bacterium]|nr:type II secretion system F family protein [Candidatus Kerfeldbacteria bacterium]